MIKEIDKRKIDILTTSGEHFFIDLTNDYSIDDIQKLLKGN